jgi:predicted membrane-bound spermidine synthase/Flp pilus assembly protein TadD
MIWFFVFFFVSGFCSILYEMIWLRLAMAQFGVTTPLVSIVLSTFMAGLGVGSWLAGRLIRRYEGQIHFPPLRLYALSELLIGVSAVLVPFQFLWGHLILERVADQVAVSSGLYYLMSGLWLTLTLVPWCACMGATIPLAMLAIRRDSRYEARRSFSFLYLANVVGAVAGAIVPLYFIESFGFRSTLHIGALLNTCIAISAALLTFTARPETAATAAPETQEATAKPEARKSILVLLFTTGLATMGMEVIWIRLFTPYLGPLVYSFAMILASYLAATFAGAQVYRLWSRQHRNENGLAWVALGVLGLLPVLTADARVSMYSWLRVVLGVAPFAGLMGFLTPMLVDRWSSGDPDSAGRAYATNVVGCILGPLVAGFLLLPVVGERVSMLILVLPWFAMAVWQYGIAKARMVERVIAGAMVLAALVIFSLTQDYETQFAQREVLRDSTATVIATGSGMQKALIVNGVGITKLTPITKMMAHLTLASLDHTPRNVLVICFGMGTTFRSAVSWQVDTTAVDLVPSVPKFFPYFHADGDAVLASPLAHVVIDDGRRYVERSGQRFDVIAIDPPPPVQAAGSSLLYSEEFYTLLKEHLAPGGILQQWLPDGDAALVSSVARALQVSFPYVRVFGSMEHWGWHFLASMRPIPVRTSAELVARMSPAAIADMLEWGPARTPGAQFDLVLSQETSTNRLITLAPETVALQDDRPINEYYFFRERSSNQHSDASDLARSFHLYQAGRYQEAILAAKAAVKADPNSADAYNNLAVTYAALRMWDEAAQNAQEALRIRPNYQLARNNLVWILEEKQKAPTPTSHSPAAQPYVALSGHLYEIGKFPECITAANQAIKLDPKYAEAYNNLAACNGSLGNWDEAIRAANQAVVLKPDFQLAKNNLEWALQQKSQGATVGRPK